MNYIAGPKWNSFSSNKVVGEDHLGIKYVAINISDVLQHGITSITPRARYWSFFSWVLNDFIINSENRSKDAFIKHSKRLEWHYILANIAEGQHSSGIIGITKGYEIWNNSGDSVPLVTDYVKARLGGYDTYRNVMKLLGLTREADMEKGVEIDRLTEKGYEAILMTTFTIDLVFFEKLILPKLLEGGCSYIGLYTDGNMLNRSLSKGKFIKELGKSYIVRPVNIANAFHPKMFLMLGEKKAKLIIGSGNITPAGIITNKEVFNVYKYEEENNNSMLSLIKSAFNVFQTYNKIYPSKIMETVFNKIEKYPYLYKQSTNDELYLLSNEKETIYQQIKKTLSYPIQKITILAPYFDSKLSVINMMSKDFPVAEINILLQNRTSNFPKDCRLVKNASYNRISFINESDKRYHGKIFCFDGEDYDYMVYGSANCSRPALLETLHQGNAEVVIFERLSKGTIIDFLKNEINSHPNDEEVYVLENSFEKSFSNNNVFFIEAIFEKDEIILLLESKEKIEEVILEDLKGNIKQENEIYICTWKGDFSHLDIFFEFKVVIGEESFTLIGWQNDSREINRTQLKLKDTIYSRIKNDPYISDYKNIVDILEELLNKLILTENDLNNSPYISKRKSIRIHKEADLNSKEANNISDNIEDYYFDGNELEDSAYGYIGKIDVIGELIKQLLRPFNFREDMRDRNSQIPDEGTIDKDKNIVRDIDVEEKINKKMKRFMDKFHNGLFSNRYLEMVTEDILIKILYYTLDLWKKLIQDWTSQLLVLRL